VKKTITIVGGGVIGLSAAVAMHQLGFAVNLIDAGSLEVNPSDISHRVYAINQASQQLFQRLGVWETLDKARLSPYQQMVVWDAASNAHIDFDARMVAAAELGSIIDETNLRYALLRLISSTDIILLAHQTTVRVTDRPDGIEIRTNNNTIQSDLLLIADGALSSTRELLNVALTQWSYHQEALVATVETANPHRKTAYQVFHPNGVLAFLPLANQHQCSIVWSGAPGLTQHRLRLSEDNFNQELTTAFAEKLGAVKLVSKRFTFPLTMRHVKQYVGAHWLLMGDAAHTIHPLAGLGLNVGLADLATWIDLLQQEKQPKITKKILGAYQRHRKHAVWQAIALMEGLKALFLNPFPPIAALRGLGLNLCNRLTPLKRLFIKHAAGE
jgi:2-octaprenylphenol hydroxylase